MQRGKQNSGKGQQDIQMSIDAEHTWQVDYATGIGKDAKTTPYVASVKTFVRVPAPDPRLPPLRLALVDFYNVMAPTGRCLRANMQSVRPGWEWYPVELDGGGISAKLVGAHPNGYEKGVVFFMRVHKSLHGGTEEAENA